MSQIGSTRLGQGGNETSIAWNRYQRLSQFSLSESQFKILIVSNPCPCLDLLFSRNSVKSMSKFCNPRSSKRRMLLSGCFWLKMEIMFRSQNVQDTWRYVFFPVQSSDCDVMWSRAPGRFELKDVLLGCFLRFVDIKGFFITFHHLPPFLGLQYWFWLVYHI